MHTSKLLRHSYAVLFMAALPVVAQTRPVDVDGMLSTRFVYNPAVAVTTAAPGDDVDAARALPYWVAVGNWKQVGATLSTMPAADAERLHAHIVDGLLVNANNLLVNPAASDDAQKRPIVVGKPLVSKPPIMIGDLLEPVDVLDLVDALPASVPLSNSVAAQLGQLLAKTTGATGLPGPVLERLRQGTAHLGGNDASHLPATIRFLLSAGRPDLAVTFLPDEKAIFSLESPVASMLYLQCLMVATEKADNSHDSVTANSNRHTALRLTLALLGQSMPEKVAQTLVSQAIELSEKTGDLRAIDSWIGDLIARRAPELPAILGYFGRPISPDGGQANYDQRNDRLSQQQRLFEMISAAHLTDGPSGNALRAVLRLYAMNWATEADFTRLTVSAPPHPVALGEGRSFQQTSGVKPNVVKEISAEQLLLLDPADNWQN